MHKQFNKITSNSMYNCGGVGNNSMISMVNMNKSMLNSSMMSSMYNSSGGDSNSNYGNYLQHCSRIGLVRKRLLNSSACYLEISGEELKHNQYACGGGSGNNNNNCSNNNNNRNSSVNKSIRCKQTSFGESPIKKVRALHKNFSCGDIHQQHNKKQQIHYKQSHKQNNLNHTSIINDNAVYDIHTNRKYNNISIVISQPNNKKRMNSVSTMCNGNNHNVNKVNKGNNSHKEIETIEEIHFEFVKVIQSKNKAIYTVHN